MIEKQSDVLSVLPVGVELPWKCHQVNEERLRSARSQEDFALHLAGLEWSLAESIVIDSAEDIKSRLNWQERFQPYDHQVQHLFTFCRKLPVSLIADDVGLGKTITAGLILAELMVRRRVTRALVLCPKILAPQWVEELDSKFGITAKVAYGRDVIDEFRRQTPVVVTTYDSVRDRLKHLSVDSFGMLILDEAHKLRNLHGAQKAPLMATEIRDALVQRLFKYVLMLTATPIQNRLWDLYALLDYLALAKGIKHPLGNPEDFKRKYVKPGTSAREIVEGQAAPFRAILRNYLVRTRRGDAKLAFPERVVQLARVTASAEECTLHTLVATHIQHLSGLLQTSLAQAMMSSPQALAAQMENMVKTGKFAPEVAAEARRIADSLGLTAKLKGLLSLLKNLQLERPADWRVVVFTIRKETQQTIGKALSDREIPYGYITGGQARQNQRTIEGFRRDAPDIHVIVSTDAGAEGINLQVANVIVNFDLPWNPMIVEQRIGRLQRLASKHAHVIVWNLVIAGTVEEKVVARLMQKLQLISHAIGDIEAILESVGLDGEGEEANSFESQIRELVVKALLGQNIERDTELRQQSIERAQKALEEQRGEIEQTLGPLTSLHRSGPSMPKLSRVEPSLPSQEFVLRAKRADGARVDQVSDGLYAAHAPGKPKELLAFSEAAAIEDGAGGIFMGNAPKLYLPGRPPFERLTQFWVDTAGHRIVDLRPQSGQYSDLLGRKWCDTLDGAQFTRAEVKPSGKFFQGSFTSKAKAGNAVDSYEKLIRTTYVPDGHTSFEITGEPAGLLKHEILPTEILANSKHEVKRAVEADKDVGEFCRFYQARLNEESAKASNDDRMLHKLESDLSPVVFADIAAVQGALYEGGVVAVHFVLDGKHDYTVELVAIPVTGQILKEPAREPCAATGRRVPVSCLGVSAVSGKKVLGHLMDFCEFTNAAVLEKELLTSELSGKRFRADQKTISASGAVGHRSEFVVCAMTRDIILPSEAGTSQVSGRQVRKELLRRSAKAPGRIGAKDEMIVCAASGKTILRDEAAKSEVSGSYCDLDLLVPSDRSGKLALKEELVRCQQSGALLLPQETAKCCLSGKVVDTRWLGQSEVSGAWALKSLLVECVKTGKRVLPQELEICELTGQRVVASELEMCHLSRRRALRDRLVRSDLSGLYMLPELAVRSGISKRIGAPSEMITCCWNEKSILSDEAGVCLRTGLSFAKELLNERGELIPLRELLDGTDPGVSCPELVAWLRRERPDAFGGLKTVTGRLGPTGGVRLACGEIRTLLGFKVRYAGVLIRDRGERQLLGRGTVGRRTPEGWVAEQDF